MVIRHWHKFAREVAGNPSLEALKARFGWGFKATWSNGRCPGHGRGVGNRLSLRVLLTQAILYTAHMPWSTRAAYRGWAGTRGSAKQPLLSVFSALLLGEVIRTFAKGWKQCLQQTGASSILKWLDVITWQWQAISLWRAFLKAYSKSQNLLCRTNNYVNQQLKKISPCLKETLRGNIC